MEAIINAEELIGAPFVDGGRNHKVGLDCYGLVMEVFRRCGIELEDYTISCSDASAINANIEKQKSKWRKVDFPPPVPSLIVMRFNQVVFCNHTGVYIGNDRFIHTAEKMGVHIDSIQQSYWKRKIEGFYVPNWSDVSV